MKTPDIANLNYAELNQLQDAISERMKEMRAVGITQLKATIVEQAGILGIELKELMPRRTRRRCKPEEVH